MNQPQPDPTPRGPAYQGRLLPRPDEEVVDQGLDFDVRTLLSRRRMLKAFGLGAGMFALAACGVDAASTSDASATGAGGVTEIPDETAGPYPGDGSNGPDVLEESGIVRSDIRSSFGTSTTTAEGVPLEFELTILDMAEGQRAVRRRRRLRLALRPRRQVLHVLRGRGGRELPPRRPGHRRRGQGPVHQHRPGLLLRPLAAHPLRGLPGRGVDHRLRQRPSPPPSWPSRRTSSIWSTPRRATRPRWRTWPR